MKGRTGAQGIVETPLCVVAAALEDDCFAIIWHKRVEIIGGFGGHLKTPVLAATNVTWYGHDYKLFFSKWSQIVLLFALNLTTKIQSSYFYLRFESWIK